MIKINPSYKVTVFTPESTITVEYPLTMQATVTRGVLSESNTCTIQLYNLSPSTREQIYQDVFVGIAPEKQKFVQLEAGYNGSLSLIFKGRILQAYSHKAGGQTDIITEIQAQALDVFDCETSKTFDAGITYKEAYRQMASDLPNVVTGAIGNLAGSFRTPTTFEGRTFEQINKLTGGHSFIDNGVLNTLMNNEVLNVPVPVISDKSVLLETPRRRDAYLDVRMLFEPSLLVGQLLEIESKIFPDFNGQYKVLSITHNIMISASQTGARTTDVSLWVLNQLPASDLNLTDEKAQTEKSKVKGETIEPVSMGQPSAVKDVYNYIQANGGKIPSSKITKNISWAEMIGHNNTNSDRLSECTLSVLSNVYSTAQTLQNFINSNFPGRKITITSGWRSTANNASCGGQAKSKHLYGLAVDFYVQNEKVSTLVNALKKQWQGWIGDYGSFAHAQINSTKGRANDV